MQFNSIEIVTPRFSDDLDSRALNGVQSKYGRYCNISRV